DTVSRGQDQYRSGDAFLSHTSQDSHAIHVRQSQVKDDQIVMACRLIGRLPVGYYCGGESVAFQPVLDERGNAFLVFSYQYPTHVASWLTICAGRSIPKIEHPTDLLRTRAVPP